MKLGLSSSSGPRASRSLMRMSERDARGPEEHKHLFLISGAHTREKMRHWSGALLAMTRVQTMPYNSIFRPGLFDGQTIIVTGGGSGLGRCTAHELRSLGARLALVGRTQEKLDVVKKELGDSDTFTFAADLREEDQVKAAVDGVLKWGGRIDGLMNNAGGQFPAPLKDISLNGWNAVIRNTMTATFLMSKEVYLRSMEQH